MSRSFRETGGNGDARVTGGQVMVSGQPVAVTDQGDTTTDKTLSP